MTVWIAASWSYDDYEIEGVYADFDDALLYYGITKDDPNISRDNWEKPGDGMPSMCRSKEYHGFHIRPYEVKCLKPQN